LHRAIIKKIGFARGTMESFQLGNKRSVKKPAGAAKPAHRSFAAFGATHDSRQLVPPVDLLGSASANGNCGFNLLTVSRR